MQSHHYLTIFIVLGLIMLLKKSSDSPRGIHNNNPLNIRKSSDSWRGATGDDGEFVTFDSPVFGIRAATKILITYKEKYGLNTVAEIISRWAPPSENDTTSYIESVSRRVGVGRNEQLLISDLPELIKAMIQHENGVQPYADETILTGINEGLA